MFQDQVSPVPLAQGHIDEREFVLTRGPGASHGRGRGRGVSREGYHPPNMRSNNDYHSGHMRGGYRGGGGGGAHNQPPMARPPGLMPNGGPRHEMTPLSPGGPPLGQFFHEGFGPAPRRGGPNPQFLPSFMPRVRQSGPHRGGMVPPPLSHSPPLSPTQEPSSNMYHDDGNYYSDDDGFRFERRREIHVGNGIQITVQNEIANNRPRLPQQNQQYARNDGVGGNISRGALHTGPFRGGRREFHRFLSTSSSGAGNKVDDDKWQHDLFEHTQVQSHGRGRGRARGAFRGGRGTGDAMFNREPRGLEGEVNRNESGYSRRGRRGGRRGFGGGGRGRRMRSSSEGAVENETTETAGVNGAPNAVQNANGGGDRPRGQGTLPRGRGRGRGMRFRRGRGASRPHGSGSVEGVHVCHRGSDSNESEGVAHQLEGGEHSEGENGIGGNCKVILPSDDIHVETECADAYIDDEVGASDATAHLHDDLEDEDVLNSSSHVEGISGHEDENKLCADGADGNENFVSADENSGEVADHSSPKKPAEISDNVVVSPPAQ